MEYLGWIVALWLACIVWCLLDDGHKEPSPKANAFALYLMLPIISILWLITLPGEFKARFSNRGNKSA
jgi:bacteriorhodopsin